MGRRNLARRWALIFLFILEAGGAIGRAASNYDGYSWESGPVPLLLDTSGVEALQPGQGAALQAAIARAAGEWNAALGLPLLSIAVSPVAIAADARCLGDGISGIYFSRQISASQGFGAQFGYAEASHSRLGRFLEADLIFNPVHVWQVYDGPLHYDANGSRVAEMHRVALHEMGHLLGLTHPADDAELTIMRSKMSDVDALTSLDLADARRVASLLFWKNRPRVSSPSRTRLVVRGDSLVLRGATNGFFVRKAWVELASS
jgi:hypothetical protein